jgi:type VI protein secretion system component Hcp
MALNTYLTLKLDNVAVAGSVTQKGREGTIEVNSLEWSFDADGNLGEIKWISDVDSSTTDISNGLTTDADVDATFNFYTPSVTGVETNHFRLAGSGGRVTSVNIWMPNNTDPNLTRYATTMQVTMSFPSVTETWLADSTTAVIS